MWICRKSCHPCGTGKSQEVVGLSLGLPPEASGSIFLCLSTGPHDFPWFGSLGGAALLGCLH